MSGGALRGLAVAGALGALASAGALPAASAALAFAPCAEGGGFECAPVAVPLDRDGHVPGTISLSVERRTASGAPLATSQTAVLALAGGPGQAADPLASDLAKAIAPALGSRDMLVFDQRGTGRSSPLSCPIFGDARALAAATEATLSSLVERCALQIGPARGSFTTAESVEDIESVRHAAGYRKLVLYGTSYGTKVALQYAERYPQRVEALVLDSVVPPDGPEPFAIASFQAIGPAMSELCAARACAGITHDALRDLARLAARLRRHSLTGSAYDGRGRRHSVSLGELDLLLILEVGDVNPAMRALLPAAVRASLAGDTDPLLRLNLLAEGFIPNVPTQPPAETEQAEDQGNALFTDTSCEETHFPWQRAAPAATRHAEALAAVRAVPARAFYPFDPTTALHAGRILECEGWPDASPPPATRATLPAVPALLLSGAQDLRTPTFNAREVAAQIPGAQVLVVPHTGHSVLGSDFSGCAETAVASFFQTFTAQPCPGSRNIFAPTPVPPRSLRQVHTPPGLPGRPGRTLTAVVDAIVDLDRQVIAATLQAEQELPSGSSFGGLRGGFAKLTSSAAILKRFAFISGVTLSGRFPVREGQLQPATIHISGSRAAHGTVTFSLRKHVTGTLGGRRFDVSLARVRLSSVPAQLPWPSRPRSFPLARLIDRPKLAGR